MSTIAKNDFIDALTGFGLDVLDPVLDGSVQRCKCRGSRQKSGWYVGNIHNDNVYCSYGDWRTGEKSRYTDSGMAEAPGTINVWRLLAEAEKKKQKELHQETAQKASDLFAVTESLIEGGDRQGHPYLKKKGVFAYGEVRVHEGNFIIPLYKANGVITGYQAIDGTGKKKFLFGTEKKGACFVIEGSAETVCICEGYATGASIHKATGLKVLVAFDAGNMMTVAELLASKGKKNVLICTDNDHGKEKNTGIETAKKITLECGFPYVYPTDIAGTDFNDMHQEMGLEAVKLVITTGRVVKIYNKQDAMGIKHFDDIVNPPGKLKDIADYYNATSVKPQPLFAIAAGLILGSVLMGRRYNTGEFCNFTSLYIAVVAKSGTGKDHVKTVVRNILNAAKFSWMERSGGFTAANTVIKSLERQPLQLSFWEEFGLRLKEAGSNNRSLYNGVFRQLLDIWSSCHSTSLGEEYSDGTIPVVNHPALTLVGLSTPQQLFEAMTESLIEQGFVNRILPFVSNAERVATPLRSSNLEPPEEIVEFCQSLWPGQDFDLISGGGEIACPGADQEKIIGFSPGAIKKLNDIEQVVVSKSNELERIGLSDLLSRNREMTMRVSLIAAVMDSCEEILEKHVDWSWKLVDALYEQYAASIKRVSSGSGFEQIKKQALADLRNRGVNGIRVSHMPKTSPWSRWDKKLRTEILTELQDSGLADLVERKGKRGPTATIWVAVEEE